MAFEFMQPCLVYLGADSAAHTPVTFQRPGALHKARWMAKLLYTLKLALQHIALLPQRTITTCAEDSGVCQRHFAHLRNVVAVDAAWNYLTLYHHLYAYKSVDEDIAASAIKALERHLWYLTGEMLPLALFSTKVPVGEHLQMPS
ncbi:hypothetical protein CesoFtcFv8_010664 [Champsocephalus esox]|uniref:Uncharacterized protein n=1 Tax=Champsocephalus esox TaxID=159716 RepID=A0AAN8C5Z9_9TELE|nr:hypothetical protein CesoFtcFv8_010664 [Champsocephalus esox]